MKNTLRNCFWGLCLLWCGAVYAQEGRVSGKVTDALTANGIPGVTVMVKGTSVATQTDAAGNYSIEAALTDTLVFRSLGFAPQEIAVDNRTTVDVVLEDQGTELEEVVVIGYGTQRQRELTTAVSTVRAEEIVRTPAATAMQSLQGRVAGVQIVSSGAPGASPTVRLRGIGSFEGGAAPLYVVDGMFFDNIDFLNPNDIETISVLKDASAAAIYGVRAGNGVVLIETKSGAYNQQGTIEYDAYYGIQNPQNVLQMANTEQFVQYVQETGASADNTFVQNAIARFGAHPSNPNLPNVNTNWYNEVMSPAPIQNHNLTFNGGGENTRYSIGGSYFDQEGLLNEHRNNYRRMNFRVKVDSRVKDWLSVGGNFNASMARQYIGENTAWFRSYFSVPILPVFDENNTAAAPHRLANAQLLGYRGSQNPFFPLYYVDNRHHIAKLLGNFHLEANIIESKLKFRTQYNYGLSFINRRRVDFEYNDGVTRHQSAIRRENTSDYDQVWDNFLTYDDNFGKHNLNVVLGQSFRSEYSELLYARGTAISPAPSRAAEQYWYLRNATDFDLDDVGDANENTLNANLRFLSFFGRAAYNYDERYLFYTTFRRDGNNKFQKKWGNFATVGLGWIISSEEFFDVGGIDFLKLRASWGQLGNDAISPAVGAPTLVENSGAINDTRVVGRRLDPTYDLITEWETTVETNFGLDAQFLNSRLSLEADYFIRDTRSLAVGIVPPVIRASERRSVGEIRNTGVELNLNWRDQLSEDFSYSIGGNIATLKNTVRGLGGAGYLDAGSSEFRQRSIIGQPYQAFFGYDVVGVFQEGHFSSAADIAQMAQVSGYNPEFIAARQLQAGDLIFRDVNGDGVIDDEDRVVLGSYLPKFTWGLNLGFSYKRFDFSALLQGQSGYSILNRKRGELIFTNDTNIDADLAANLWRGPGTSNSYPSASGLRRSWNQPMSSYYVEDGSYFRVQNVRLSYSFFGRETQGGAMLPRTRLTFTAERPLTVFRYNGFNPEVPNGVDREVYPVPAVYTLGLSISL
ncbi:TonB-linked outer membrane protein, SusC/RagA family [Parapedobacter composti]|uniref:TonB-linked outer membrane protein, SusC/RagA family n=1 Tax=Parapedobacter composti TaxID=623281 RepID=A0A1I1IE82_9SPHI|nr:TonB-dependent receptor [Parapedobacter composti]SFC34546.1 TonB-linked outer membrane protein, SusC/RagA family [Parapedobacter composti]